MRALVISGPADGPERSTVETWPDPHPGPGQVTIEVAHAGLNFLDVMARRGDPGYVREWPFVPGLEVAGTIRETGAGVTGLEPGQQVAAFTGGGGLAEITVADAALTVALPDGVTGRIAAAAPLLLTSAWLLITEVGRVRPGDAVLMHSAAGGIGAAVAQLLPVVDAEPVIGTVGRAEKVEQARTAGWKTVLTRGEVTAGAVLAAAGGRVDVVLDPLGTSMLELDVGVAAPGGRIVLFGNPSGDAPAPLPGLGSLIGGNIAIAGFSISRLAVAAPDRVAAALRRVLGLIAEGRISLATQVVDGLDDVPAAHQRLADGDATGKYVVRVAG
jgi:NADPH2:quinone reductase